MPQPLLTSTFVADRALVENPFASSGAVWQALKNSEAYPAAARTGLCRVVGRSEGGWSNTVFGALMAAQPLPGLRFLVAPGQQRLQEPDGRQLQVSVASGGEIIDVLADIDILLEALASDPGVLLRVTLPGECTADQVHDALVCDPSMDTIDKGAHHLVVYLRKLRDLLRNAHDHQLAVVRVFLGAEDLPDTGAGARKPNAPPAVEPGRPGPRGAVAPASDLPSWMAPPAPQGGWVSRTWRKIFP